MRLFITGLVMWSLITSVQAQQVLDPGVRVQQDIKQQNIPKQPDYSPIEIEKSKPQKPITSEICFPIRKLKVISHDIKQPKQIWHIKRKYKNQCLAAKDITELLTVLNKVYAEADYFQAQSFIKGLTKQGDLEVEIKPSRLEEMIIRGESREYKALKHFHFGQKKGEILRFSELESAIDSINANAALEGRLKAEPGSKPNLTKLYVDLKEKDRLRGSIGLNNQGQSITGNYRMTPTIDLHNVLRIGDSWGLRYIGNSDTNVVVVHGRLPVAPKWTLSGNYIYSDFLTQFFTESQSGSPLINFHGRYQGAELALNKEIWRRKGYILSGSGGFRYKSTARELNSQALAAQEERVLFGQVYGQKKYKTGVLSLGGEIDWGMPMLGATQAASNGRRDIPDGRFIKIEGFANLQQKVPLGIFTSSLRGQWMPEAAYSVEHMILGGMNSIRGYTEGVISGEQGFQQRSEYILRPEVKNKYLKTLTKSVQPVIFWDHGLVSHPYAAPNQISYLASVGGGLNVNLFDEWIKASVYYGYPLSKPSHIQVRDDGRIHFTIQIKGF